MTNYRWYWMEGMKKLLTAMFVALLMVGCGDKDGLVTEYYKNGKVMTSVGWKPNGEKCPVTNLKDGNGVKAYYTPNRGCMIAPPTRTAKKSKNKGRKSSPTAI
jgi:antitoxin component YwqK of YwqJK toxin-antitoxin module